MNEINNALEIGIETMSVVKNQAEILATSKTYGDTVYILQDMKAQLDNGIKLIDELIGENNE